MSGCPPVKSKSMEVGNTVRNISLLLRLVRGVVMGVGDTDRFGSRGSARDEVPSPLSAP